MLRKTVLIGALLILFMLFLTQCNLPKKENAQTPSPTQTTAGITVISTPTAVITPTSGATLCDNSYQPSREGDTWVFSGSNNAVNSYARSDTIIRSDSTSFTTQITISGVTYTVDYSCTEAGLVAADPVQQYLGALLNIPGSQISVKLNSASGVSLPVNIQPGDEWQQLAEVEADINGTNMDGWVVFDYTAVGHETITVPAGTYDSMRVAVIIRIEVTPLRIHAGTYDSTLWMVPNVGIVKTDGTSHIPGIEFSDGTELTSFTPSQ